MEQLSMKSLKIRSTIKPKQPSFNEWCKMFNVSLLYKQEQKKYYNTPLKLINEKPVMLSNFDQFIE